MEYYYALNGNKVGPLSLAQLQTAGIAPDTLVWKTGMAEWRPAQELPELAGLWNQNTAFPPPPPAQGYVPPTQQSPGYQGPQAGPPPQGGYQQPGYNQLGGQPGNQYGNPQMGQFQSWEYASFLRRLAAAIIDALIMYIPGTILQMIFGVEAIVSDFQSHMKDQNIEAAMAVLVGLALYLPASIIIQASYEAFFTSSAWMATPGKKALGLQVVDKNGQRISLGTGFVRHFSKWISAIICYIGFLFPLFDEQKRALHDRLANTLVMKDNS